MKDSVRVVACQYPNVNQVETSYFSLSGMENKWANRFVFPKDRFKYMFRRSTIKKMVADLLQLDPLRVELQADTLGKPILKNLPYPISISRTEHFFVMAISPGQPIGIDMENLLRPMPEWLDIAGLYFHQDEIHFLNESKDLSHFYKIWTRKESYLKLQGHGLTRDLSNFCVIDPLDIFIEDAEIDQTTYRFVEFKASSHHQICVCLPTSSKNKIHLQLIQFKPDTQGLSYEPWLDCI